MSPRTRWIKTLGCPGLALAMAGCSFVPKSRLTQIEGQYATLAAETSKLKDESLSLRSRNRELTQRAVEDARRVRELEVANGRLTASISAYQKEREAMADSFERIKQSVQLASNGATTAMLDDRFENFAKAHPGCSYNPETGLWRFPTDQLFQPGGDDWQPSALLLVDAFGRLLDDHGSPVEPTRLTVLDRPADVQRVSLGPEKSGTSLAQRRAIKLSGRLSSRPAGATPPVPVDVREATDGNPAIEIQLTRRPAGSGS